MGWQLEERRELERRQHQQRRQEVEDHEEDTDAGADDDFEVMSERIRAIIADPESSFTYDNISPDDMVCNLNLDLNF